MSTLAAFLVTAAVSGDQIKDDEDWSFTTIERASGLNDVTEGPGERVT